jgi:hypothetical protein
MMTLDTPVLGIPVRIETDSPAVLGLADSSFGAWRELPAPLVETAGVLLRFTVSQELAGVQPDIHYRRHGTTRVELLGAVRGWADTAARRAEVGISPALLERPEQLRYQVVEATVLFLLTGPNRFPVHASGVVKNGVALLFAGRSGAGKSTLAWLAGEAGWDVLSDDIVYVQSQPSWRLWAGGAARTYLAAGAEQFIPALHSHQAVLRDSRGSKYALGRPLPRPPLAERAILCLLERGQTVGFTPVTRDAALASLVGAPEPGFDVFPAMAARALGLLAERAVRLETAADPRDVVPELDEILRHFFPAAAI